VDTNKSLTNGTPRQKIIKLVSNVMTSGKNLKMAFSPPMQAQSTKNSRKPANLDPAQTTLLNNYY